ncbi:MAG: electron transfer flavoprotein subunit alpha/FixB family protein, partial [Oscillospiraceae bacterium]|nr:electron transfer flavoprotein subunit alpha/FixB family protein [Oscillospiraceae bacterium]
PRLAARLHTGLTADCTHLDIDMNTYIDFLRTGSTLDVDAQKWAMEDINLKMTRPAFGGHLLATIICPRFRPCMSTVRPGVMKKAPFDEAKAAACKTTLFNVQLDDAQLKSKVLEVVKEAKNLVDLLGAEVIVSVGQGIANDPQKGIAMAQELADVLGGVLGASRAVVDAGWISADHQVGQTGKTVRPKIYIALGISGAIQHKAGMQDSELIIAVNKNAMAPIFEVAEYGITGDLWQVLPLMIDAAKAAKGV